MRNWKVIIEYGGKLLNVVIVVAKYYSDPYLQVEKEYPGCIVKNVSEIES